MGLDINIELALANLDLNDYQTSKLFPDYHRVRKNQLATHNRQDKGRVGSWVNSALSLASRKVCISAILATMPIANLYAFLGNCPKKGNGRYQ
jgi:hypothetical protein